MYACVSEVDKSRIHTLSRGTHFWRTYFIACLYPAGLPSAVLSEIYFF
jgi:NADPH-dependent 7-cyano-7-deazaguanine reductase QueF-like protein